jgi:rubredoxin
VYDSAEGAPEQEVKPGTAFEELPKGWGCPKCKATKELFEMAGELTE